MAEAVETLSNFVGGRWIPATATSFVDVHNPARGTVIARAPLSTSRDVDLAVTAATNAFAGWSETPPVVRARAMFRFKALLEEHFEELARLVTTEHGKTLDESRGSVRRGIECVEVACGGPSMLMGYGLENVAPGIDCTVMRQPIGVCAAIAPFNFPAMVPLWFLPFAVVCGNTFVLKPSEQVPLSQARMFELLQQCDLPPGVVNLVHGGREVVEAICDHPGIRAVSFVGSTPVARLVYQRATHAGKRVQALGGAKNFVIVMPDADLDRSIPIIAESFYGCAGERCLAGSVLVPVGEAHAPARDRLIEAAAALKVGDGLEPGVGMGPVISRPHHQRVVTYVERGVSEGARLALDGRDDSRGRSARRLLHRSVGVRRGESGHGDRPRRDLRPGGVGVPCQGSRRGLPADGRAPQRQRDLDLHQQREGGARVQPSRDGVDGRRQHRRRRAHGLLSVRRRARQLLRRPQGARPRCLRVLHGQESHHLEVVSEEAPCPETSAAA